MLRSSLKHRFAFSSQLLAWLIEKKNNDSGRGKIMTKPLSELSCEEVGLLLKSINLGIYALIFKEVRVREELSDELRCCYLKWAYVADTPVRIEPY